jgi:aryl-alcohol dehydrogenase-like predicted oxidoreductase
MRYRLFPGTSISVSEVGFGTWTLSTGWWGDKTDAEAVAMLRRALDEHGVTFFDAADAYGNGPRRAAARRGVPRPAERRRAGDQGRLRHL